MTKRVGKKEKLEDQGGEQDAKEAARAAKKIAKSKAGQARREQQKMEKFSNLADLMLKDRVAPPPWALQLPSHPPRQNVTGRDLPLKVPTKDDTLPSTEAERTAFVANLLHAMMDVRQAEDAISPTVDFWYVWLKPSLEGKYSYSERDMEWVCRKLVSIAEGLHNHGLGATEIFCPRTIQKAQAAREMTFKQRIDKLAELMRKSKARCNNFLLNNTLEDTVALIDQKLGDQGSNGANNRTRSLKLLHSNKVLGMQKGEKWPKDANGMPIIPEMAAPSPQIMGVDISAVDPVYDAPAQPAEGFQSHPQLLPWPVERAQYPPMGQRPPPLAYPDSVQPGERGFGGFLGRRSLPIVRPTNDMAPVGFNEEAADRAFEDMYASHHGLPMPTEEEEAYMSQLFSFEDDGHVEDARFKRPRLEQPDKLSVNSLLRGKTAKQPRKDSKSTRRL